MVYLLHKPCLENQQVAERRSHQAYWWEWRLGKKVPNWALQALEIVALAMVCGLVLFCLFSSSR